MRKKSGFTMVEQAVVLVPEFEKVVRKLEQQVTLRGQSGSTLNNYIRRIALFVVHFGKLPEQIDPEEINEYLAALALDPRSPSRSSFKHMVLPGSKNTVKMGIGVQQNREQEYSKNGNKNTVISINIINQGLHCIINKKQDCDGLKNKITYHYVSRDSQAS